MRHPARLSALGLALALGACAQIVEGPGADACGAAARQGLVGQRADVLDASALPAGSRVLLPGMSATMDFLPDRLNIEIDGADTVARVYCG